MLVDNREISHIRREDDTRRDTWSTWGRVDGNGPRNLFTCLHCTRFSFRYVNVHLWKSYRSIRSLIEYTGFFSQRYRKEGITKTFGFRFGNSKRTSGIDGRMNLSRIQSWLVPHRWKCSKVCAYRKCNLSFLDSVTAPEILSAKRQVDDIWNMAWYSGSLQLLRRHNYGWESHHRHTYGYASPKQFSSPRFPRK